MDLTKYCKIEGHGVCYHGRTAPTDAACPCGAACFVHCGCPLNRARRAREQADLDARNAEAHAREMADEDARYAGFVRAHAREMADEDARYAAFVQEQD